MRTIIITRSIIAVCAAALVACALALATPARTPVVRVAGTAASVTSPSCGWIDGSEFPRIAGRAYGQCWYNLDHGHRFQFVGRYDGHRRVWRVVGPTTVFISRSGWFETS